jgi:hypothetical protein
MEQTVHEVRKHGRSRNSYSTHYAQGSAEALAYAAALASGREELFAGPFEELRRVEALTITRTRLALYGREAGRLQPQPVNAQTDVAPLCDPGYWIVISDEDGRPDRTHQHVVPADREDAARSLAGDLASGKQTLLVTERRSALAGLRSKRVQYAVDPENILAIDVVRVSVTPLAVYERQRPRGPVVRVEGGVPGPDIGLGAA